MKIQWKVPLLLFVPVCKAGLSGWNLGLCGYSEMLGATLILAMGKRALIMALRIKTRSWDCRLNLRPDTMTNWHMTYRGPHHLRCKMIFFHQTKFN